MNRYMLAGLAVLVFLAACGDPGGTTRPRSERPSSDLKYGCGAGGTFAPRDIEEGPEPSQEILDALHELRQTMDGAMLPEDGWRVVSEQGRTTTVLAPLGDSFASASFDKEGRGWKAAGWGDCKPRLEVEDKSVLRWAFTEGSHPPDAETTKLDVLVTEVECSGGRDIEGLVEQQVTYGETKIEVVLTAPRLKAGKNQGYTCGGTSPINYTLQLDEPIGDREVVDVSVYPSVEPVPGTRIP